MQFWNDKKLAVRLHHNEVSGKEQLIYLLLFAGIYVIATTESVMFILSDDIEELSIYIYASDIMGVFFEVLTIIYSYLINQKGDGQDIITRYICLSLPIYIQVLAIILATTWFGFLSFAVILEIVTGFFKVPVENLDFFNIDLFFLALLPIIYIYILYRFSVCFKYASGLKKENK